jgi:hypothetical protein
VYWVHTRHSIGGLETIIYYIMRTCGDVSITWTVRKAFRTAESSVRFGSRIAPEPNPGGLSAICGLLTVARFPGSLLNQSKRPRVVTVSNRRTSGDLGEQVPYRRSLLWSVRPPPGIEPGTVDHYRRLSSPTTTLIIPFLVCRYIHLSGGAIP